VTRHAVIVGAGLAGSLLACLLARRGWRVSVYEKRPDPRQRGYAGGRSINLALSIRGIAGLSGAGLADRILAAEAIRMPGRMIHARDGSTSFQPYSANPSDAINSVSRGGLNLALIIAAAEHKNVTLHFNAPCIDVDFSTSGAAFEINGRVDRAQGDLVVGTDGAFSAVRLAMMKRDRFEYSQSYLRHGYKELHIPQAGPGTYAIEPHALHIWPRGGAMMIGLPNRDGSFTCTLFWPFDGEHSFAALRDDAAVTRFFREQYPDAVPLMPTLAQDFRTNPTSSLVTIRCEPWHAGRVCLLGDAAHAIVPFYGQGMNAAFEDCLSLAAALDDHGEIADALAQYEADRKPNADAIADMALENFVEMRDLAGRADFQYRKKIEQTVHKAFGDAALPQYNLVSFSLAPYVEARRRGREMAELVARIERAIPARHVLDEAWEHAVAREAGAEVRRWAPINKGE